MQSTGLWGCNGEMNYLSARPTTNTLHDQCIHKSYPVFFSVVSIFLDDVLQSSWEFWRFCAEKALFNFPTSFFNCTLSVVSGGETCIPLSWTLLHEYTESYIPVNSFFIPVTRGKRLKFSYFTIYVTYIEDGVNVSNLITVTQLPSFRSKGPTLETLIVII